MHEGFTRPGYRHATIQFCLMPHYLCELFLKLIMDEFGHEIKSIKWSIVKIV